MNRVLILSVCCALLASMVGGCAMSFAMRDAEGYRQATRDLLASKRGAIETCYAAQASVDASLVGSVVVNFEVAAETGDVSKAAVDAAQSTAPAAVQACVVDALADLSLELPDQRTGQATFTYEFGTRQL